MKRKMDLPTISFLGIFALLVAFGALSFLGNDNPSTKNPTVNEETNKPFVLKNQPHLGDPSAPNELIVFTDFNCPHCKEWETDTLPKLVDGMIKEKKAVLYFVNYPFLLPTSTNAAMASELFFKESPDKLQAYHHKIYEKSGVITNDLLSELAHEIDSSINEKSFGEKLKKQTTLDDVSSDYAYGSELGVEGTPSLFVNGARMENPNDLNAIEAHFNE